MPDGDWYCPSCACADENAEADANAANAMDPSVEWVAMRACLAEYNQANANEFQDGLPVPIYTVSSELGQDGNIYELTATGTIVGMAYRRDGSPEMALWYKSPNGENSCKQWLGVADLRKYIKAGLAKVSGMHPEHYIYILP